MRVAVLFNDDRGLAHGRDDDHLAVEAVADEARAVTAACRANGHEVAMVGLERDFTTLAATLASLRAELVFNLVESLGGDARLEAAVAWAYELAGLRYTGSPPSTLSLCLDKRLAKAVLRHHGVATPQDCLLVTGHEPLGGMSYPAIVKPTREDASHGIDLGSVVHDEAQARQRALRIVADYRQPAIVERFVDGREFNVAVLGTGEAAETLSLGEIDFSGFPPGQPHVVTYAAKWQPESDEYRGSLSVGAGPLDERVALAIRETALAAYRALELRDYGRVDIRLDRDQNPWVLEVNPNPDISPDAGLTRAAERSGISYDRLIERIVQGALAR